MMEEHVVSELTRLPEPVPPATLVGLVMARVSRLAEERPTASLASASVGTSREERVRSWKELSAWAAALAGLAIVFVSWINGRLEVGSLLNPISSQVGAPDLAKMPLEGSAVLELGLGLLLYLAGLFAPLRSRQWHHRQ